MIHHYLPSTENANRTLPGIPFEAYPEGTNIMPPAIAGPGPFNDPPRAGTSLTVLWLPTVSKSHTMAPVVVEKARKCPSTDPENTTPGIALTAADCAGLQRGRLPHSGAGVYQTRSPSFRRSANMPPPAFGSTSELVE